MIASLRTTHVMASRELDGVTRGQDGAERDLLSNQNDLLPTEDHHVTGLSARSTHRYE